MSSSPNTHPSVLSAGKAGHAARAGFMKRSWSFPAEYQQAMKDAQAGVPLLVERLDKKDSLYYIVPFLRAGQTTLLILIDAFSGDFKETVPLKDSMVYPRVNAGQAWQILSDSLRDPAIKHALKGTKPALVWRPCEQSQSPYEPFWRFRLEQGQWLVDQHGKIHQQLTEPRMKGGALPDN